MKTESESNPKRLHSPTTGRMVINTQEEMEPYIQYLRSSKIIRATEISEKYADGSVNINLTKRGLDIGFRSFADMFLGTFRIMHLPKLESVGYFVSPEDQGRLLILAWTEIGLTKYAERLKRKGHPVMFIDDELVADIWKVVEKYKTLPAQHMMS